jgi:hypothetical protein
MKKVALMALSALALGNFGLAAKDEPNNPFTKTLAAVPAAELPSKAADLVLAAKRHDRVTTTENVVKASVQLNGAAAPAIVGAIARAVPDSASVAVGVAVAKQPKLAAAITRAAAAAAPKKVAKIVTAACRVDPHDYKSIALAAAEVAPESAKEILDAVTSALPWLTGYFDAAIDIYHGIIPSVADILARAPDQPTLADSGTPPTPGATLPRGPAIGPPYIPLSGTPGNVIPGTGGQVPPGGRDYAKP